MLVHIMTFLFGCLIAYVAFATLYIKNSKNDTSTPPPPAVHTIDNYTSAQPPPPLSTNVSSNIVYPKGCLCGRNTLGVDCANADCCKDCPTVPYTYPYNDYLYPRYIYNVLPHPHGYNLAGYHRGGRYHHDYDHRRGGRGHHDGGGGHGGRK
jgi:hypothetical protein